MVQSIAELKIALMANGMKSDAEINKGRKGGAGPAGGRFFRLKDGSCVNVPLWPSFTKKSPYSLKQSQVYYNDSILKDVELIPAPKFYSKLTRLNLISKKKKKKEKKLS